MGEVEQVCSDQEPVESHTQPGKTRGRRAEEAQKRNKLNLAQLSEWGELDVTEV